MIHNDTSRGNTYVDSTFASDIMDTVMGFLALFIPQSIIKRVVCVILLAAGLSVSRVAELSKLSERSVMSFGREVRKGNAGALFAPLKHGGRKRKTVDVEEEIVKELENGNYHTRQQVADMIKEKFQISVSLPAAGRLLKKNGYKKLKCGSLPARADTAAQRKFYENTLRPLMDKARDGSVALLFMDASHFVMGCDFLGYIYGKVRRFVTTWSGRKRYNVLGAIDFATKKVVTVTNDKYITAKEVCELLRKTAVEYAGKTIHIVLDNARYQKCQVVQTLAADLGIHFEYIPPYSPNLNLIERLWKFVKGELRTKYYDDFSTFCEKIDSVVSNTTLKYKDKVCKLINEKVQLFDNLQPVAKDTFAPSVSTGNRAA